MQKICWAKVHRAGYVCLTCSFPASTVWCDYEQQPFLFFYLQRNQPIPHWFQCRYFRADKNKLCFYQPVCCRKKTLLKKYSFRAGFRFYVEYISHKILNYFSSLTVSFLRPLARRRERTARPVLVFIRSRKPWTFFLFLLLGWNVRFILLLYICLLRKKRIVLEQSCKKFLLCCCKYRNFKRKKQRNYLPCPKSLLCKFVNRCK